ncbi:MAG: hypothetical protein V4749_05520 [Pseudomonadota bacterium]
MQPPSNKVVLLKAVEALDQASAAFRLLAADKIRDGKRDEAEALILKADTYDRFIYSVCEVKIPKGNLH